MLSIIVKTFVFKYVIYKFQKQHNYLILHMYYNWFKEWMTWIAGNRKQGKGSTNELLNEWKQNERLQLGTVQNLLFLLFWYRLIYYDLPGDTNS